MPVTKYIKLEIDDQNVDIENIADFPLSISYKIEDPDNFQVKTSADALSISLPATLKNDQIFNTFHNAGTEDMTIDRNAFKTYRKCRIEASGYDLLNGYSILTKASHTTKPEEYEINAYGNNADWIIALKDSTLYDFLKLLQFNYTTANIMASWAFDGTNPDMPFVFAPVRYMLPFDNVAFDPTDTSDQKLAHYNTDPTYLCPSLSLYWIIFNAFQSIGYKLQSTFLDTAYFRKTVMPWTFGAFPSSNGTKQDVHKFVAATLNTSDVDNYLYESGSVDKFWDLNVVTPAVNPNAPVGTYDNNDTANGTPDYSYIASNQEMRWTYQPNEDFGVQIVCLSIEMVYSGHASTDSDAWAEVHWYKTDHTTGIMQPIVNTTSGKNVERIIDANGQSSYAGDTILFFTGIVSPGDSISARVYLHIYKSKSLFGGNASDAKARVAAFQFEYFKTPLDLNATINFEDYTFFKNYKFTDFLKGVIDCFNLSLNADPVNKVIIIEPTHDYSLVHDQTQKYTGYINGDFIDWQAKQDLSQKSEISLYQDGNREYTFRMKEDSSDGCFNVVKLRIQNAYQYKQDAISNSDNIWAVTKSMLGAGKYVLPDRFSKGVTEMENSFFSTCMHYLEVNWKGITGVAPQLICIIPENISNTSASEASNAFSPKIAWYKGNVSGVGGWKFNGTEYSTLPFLFSVNYYPGGENDPILSYCDERIGTVVGVGLMRRFFLQRMAIIRNGQWYDTYFRLNNKDISNISHREYIIVAGQRWELLEIKNYKPTKEQSTQCTLRKWAPVTQDDLSAVYPTQHSINGFPNTSDIFETKYQQLMCLNSDIPQQ